MADTLGCTPNVKLFSRPSKYMSKLSSEKKKKTANKKTCDCKREQFSLYIRSAVFKVVNGCSVPQNEQNGWSYLKMHFIPRKKLQVYFLKAKLKNVIINPIETKL